ncbi:hypothetical protein [Methanosarcina sp. 1.H.A.2.2]|uniref:hypothetical protein n=1 Tax=Methanosarcina sp. 1.H.A.2.2 TaxID=1483601 RepID=UPI0012E09207|nr:hypothetical protein [Methanosarcina sp. 1.H.A.2.2]
MSVLINLRIIKVKNSGKNKRAIKKNSLTVEKRRRKNKNKHEILQITSTKKRKYLSNYVPSYQRKKSKKKQKEKGLKNPSKALNYKISGFHSGFRFIHPSADARKPVS